GPRGGGGGGGGGLCGGGAGGGVENRRSRAVVRVIRAHWPSRDFDRPRAFAMEALDRPQEAPLPARHCGKYGGDRALSGDFGQGFREHQDERGENNARACSRERGTTNGAPKRPPSSADPRLESLGSDGLLLLDRRGQRRVVVGEIRVGCR